MKYRFIKINPLLWYPESSRVIIDEILLSCASIRSFEDARRVIQHKIRKSSDQYGIVFGNNVWFDKIRVVQVRGALFKTKPMGFV